MPLKQMSFRLKPSYFEKDGPVCTRSASSFCRNPSKFLHTCYVGQMMIPCQVSTFSEFICSALFLSAHLDQSGRSTRIACFFQALYESLDQACRCLYIAHLSDMFDTQFIDRIQIIRI